MRWKVYNMETGVLETFGAVGNVYYKVHMFWSVLQVMLHEINQQQLEYLLYVLARQNLS